MRYNIRSFYFLIIAAINLIVYSPSLYHSPRGLDQIEYLYEIEPFDTLGETIQYSYSYARNRVLDAGDKILFRPLLYIFLSLEKHFFGYNFFLWQLTNVFLHLACMWLIFKTLNLICGGLFSFLCALNISIFYLSQEMVIRQNVAGYLVFVLLFLTAFYYYSQYVLTEKKSPRKLFLVCAFLLLASFAYEVGVIFALILMAFFSVHKIVDGNDDKNDRRYFVQETSKRWVFVFIIPVITYCGISAMDYLLRAPGIHDVAGFLKGASVDNFSAYNMIQNLFRVGFTPSAGFLLPVFITIAPSEMSSFQGVIPALLSLPYDIFGKLNILLLAIILYLVGGISFYLFKDMKKFLGSSGDLRSHRSSIHLWLFGITCLAIMLAYICSLAVFRMMTAPYYIWMALHHFYIITIFGGMGIYVLFVTFRKSLSGKKHLKYFAIAAFCLSIFLNGYESYQFNVKRKEMDAHWVAFIESTEKFVNKHKNETGFSFAFSGRDEKKVREITRRVPGEKTSTQVERDVSDCFFDKYINTNNPKYYLVYTKKNGLVSFSKEDDARNYYNLNKAEISEKPPEMK
jgi:hypothetical protein